MLAICRRPNSPGITNVLGDVSLPLPPGLFPARPNSSRFIGVPMRMFSRAVLCRSRFWLFIALALAPPTASWAAEAIVALPADLSLVGSEAWHRIVVQRSVDGETLGQVVDGVEFVSSEPEVAIVEESTVVPLANGETIITARHGEAEVAITVRVAGMEEPSHWSFRNHVQSVLAKAGCSSGACHGAQAGKNGFKVSLRGYDPEGDYLVLTRQMGGRRVTLADPGRSLLLTKPSGALPHGGGLRFDPGSLDYRVIAEWIADGAPPPKAEDPRLERLEIVPPSVILGPDAQQQFIVRAHFSDGRVEDVTHWAKYTSTNASVANVDEMGHVNVIGRGEGAITAWYLSQVVVATVTVPHDHLVPADVFADAPRHNMIDEFVLSKLQRLNLKPSPPASDGELIRRMMLDTIGVLPTAEETRAFVEDTSGNKRQRLIESLLDRPEFVDYWTYKWADLLLVNSEKLPGPAMWSYYNWIRNQVAANTPWDVLARRLITSSGSTIENGAANFFVLHSTPADVAETAALTFLGTSIGCAKCHNHPLEKWTNDQYFAMANLFARVRTKDAPGTGNLTVFSADHGDLVQPLRGKPQTPEPLDGEELPLEWAGDRRMHLAEWLVSPENELFSRSIVNRVWANFLGVGLVENVDDLRQTNPASNEELFAALSDYLVEQDFDLKVLMRLILESATYQRSSQVLAENAEDERFYSRYYPRRLMAEVLLDCYSQVTAVPSKFPGYPDAWRAMQLPDSNVASYFLKTFGRPERVITCECERTAEPTMVQVLHISNGDTLNPKLADPNGRVSQWLAAGYSNEQLVDELYLTALSRQPTEEERTRLVEVLAATPEAERRQAVEDLFWSVLSSKEFLFNH